ncbi:GNAT family N-acetyltransferase [Fortiea contorta]|uniref:GNAT family N-acetyltransferase n=1 Tax=Fortiea contorta TaxID=1892405 RepID=UPI0003452202|nr:GNAT family N-acetyltransferase [Fortiea contorta]
MTTIDAIIQKTASILAQGFVDDPMLAFLFPDLDSRVTGLINWFQLFVKDGYNRGTVSLAPVDQGAIVWYPADIQIFDRSFEDLLREVVVVVEKFGGLEAVQRFEQLAKIVASAEPEIPHSEVFWLAMLPAVRGQGWGGKLLQSVLEYSDAHQVGCYLVSSNSRNIGFYERYGFRRHLPLSMGEGLVLTPMWREPQISLDN